MENKTIYRKLFNFYVMHSKPQYESWNLKKIVGLKGGKSKGVEDFTNVHFKVVCGHNHEVDEFSLADLPMRNLFDWISILNIISNETGKYEPICSHIKRLIKAYIFEISKMDVEISYVLNKRHIIKHVDPSENHDSMKVGIIENENRGVVFQVKENVVPKKCMFCLRDKHLY